MNVVPVGFVLLALGVEQAVELVRHLLGDVGGELLHIAVVLQEGTGYVQRQIGAIDHALEQHQEFGDNLLDVVRHENLAVKQLNFALLAAEILLDPGKIQNALQIKGVIHIQMHPEQRVLEGVEQLAIGFFVFFLGAILGVFQPQGVYIVNGLGRLGLFLLGRAVYRGLLFLIGGIFVGGGSLFFRRLGKILQIDGHAHIPAIALQHLAHPVRIQKFLFLVQDVQRDGGAALRARAVPHFKGHAVLALPMHGSRPLLPGMGFDGHLIRRHKRGIEAQAEMADNAALIVAGVIFEEFLGAGKGHLVDVFFHFLRRHADAVIGKTQLARFFIHRHGDAQILARFALEHFVFGHCVAAVADHFADENILIGIKPALNHRHNILRVDGNIAFRFHDGSLLF